jgi:hypothetical protein
VFFPLSQSVYVYNSLEDFYDDANGYLASPNRTTAPVTLRRFQVRYMNMPGMEKPIQPLEVWYTGAYVQDQWRPRANVTVTGGLRFDIPVFGETGFPNADADGLTFRDETGQAVQYSTGKLPDPKFLWSPRAGLNWDVFGNSQTQIRGGTGVFTGRPAYVWISNQIGNTGVLTGFEQVDNTTARPFHPQPSRHKPTDVTGQPAASYELAVTDPNFRFPQIWRSNVALDHRLPGASWQASSCSTTATSTASTTSTPTCRPRRPPLPAWTTARGGRTRHPLARGQHDGAQEPERRLVVQHRHDDLEDVGVRALAARRLQL